MEIPAINPYWRLENITVSQDDGNDTNCLNGKYENSVMVSISLPISAIIIIFFSFWQRRKRLALGCLKGRPGIVYPVNVLDTYSERTTFALAFCVCCVSVLDLFVGDYYFSVETSHLPSNVQGAVWALVGVVNVGIVVLIHYPLFLCLTTRSKLYGNVVGLLYTSYWSYFYFTGFVECIRMGVWLSEENIVRSLTILPIDVCYFLLILRFLFGMLYYLRVCTKTCKKCLENNKKHELRLRDEYFVKTHFYERINYLLKPAEKMKSSLPSPSCFMRFVRKLYPSYPGFRYSRRFVCTITLSLLCLYEFCLLYYLEFGAYIRMQKHQLVLPQNSTILVVLEAANVSYIYYDVQDFFITVSDTMAPTVLASMIFMAASTIHTLLVYRHNTMRMWAGDRSSFPPQPYSYSKKLAANLTYSGYQIAYCIWGFIIIHLVLWLTVVVVWYFILAPLIYNVRRYNLILKLLRDYWLGLVITYVIYYSQVLIARVFYLQKYGKNFGINNRRSYHNAVYITWFLNVLVGFASCLLRIFKAIFFGLFLVGRIDFCLMYPGLEFFDSGYRAYVGFLELEILHTHPVIVSFCHCLWQVAHSESDRRALLDNEEDEHQILQRKRKKVIRNKWQLGYTLVRNPMLLRDRLSHLIDSMEQREMAFENGGFTIQMDTQEENLSLPVSSQVYDICESTPPNLGKKYEESNLRLMENGYCSGHSNSQGHGDGGPRFSACGDFDITRGKPQHDSVHPGCSAPLLVEENLKSDDKSLQTDSYDTKTEIFRRDIGSSDVISLHHQANGEVHMEATLVPLSDITPLSICQGGMDQKISKCTFEPNGSTGDKESNENSQESSPIRVFRSQSLEEMIESSIDPDHITDCKENGVDLVSYVEDEMWKNLLHEGTSTLKRAKQEKEKAHRNGQMMGNVLGNDSFVPVKSKDPRHEPCGQPADNVKVMDVNGEESVIESSLL